MDIRTLKKLVESGMTIDSIADKYHVSVQEVFEKMADDPAMAEVLQTHGIKRRWKSGSEDLVDPKTGLVVQHRGNAKMVIGKMGDERVSRLVAYHMEMLKMRQGVDKRNVPELYERFIQYLQYCAEHNIMPTNMNAYFAIGVNKEDISRWKSGGLGTPEHRKFAEDISSFFSSIHEQAPLNDMMNPILAIFWQKAHDGLSDQPKVEVEVTSPLGEARSAKEIADKYSGVELPD